MTTQRIELLKPQLQFLSLPHKFRAYVAGYQAGKTWAGCTGLCKHALEYPGVHLGYYAPTFSLIRDIFFETIDRVAHVWCLRTLIKEAKQEVHLFSGRNYLTTIKCKSMQDPRVLIGYRHGSALIDEIDTLPGRKADQAWAKIIARNSIKYDGPSHIDVTTTPEGFAFTYRRFEKMVREDKEKLAHLYGMVRASTYENEKHLESGYIPSLLATYPKNRVEAYLYGKFVNMETGSVYREFDRELNGSTEIIQPGEPLFFGMDFNVGEMATVIHVKRDGLPHAVAEITGALDTPNMIRKIKERFFDYTDDGYIKKHDIWIYPDTTGKNRKSVDASTSDIQLLRDEKFHISAPTGSPPVRDRINSMNAMICNGNGERRYFVNVSACPTFTENLEQQAYDGKGEPDKKHNLDHTNDAAGYFIHRDYPLRRPVTRINMRVAM